MHKISSHFRVSCFRSRVFVWMLLAIFSCSFAPSASFAQQPTATIIAWTGTVEVSGQAVTVGMVLHAGDTIYTQSQALAIIELSNGSTIHLGENTQLTLAELTQTAAGGCVSSIRLLAGWLRAFLSPQHQTEGSSFDIETPNALLGTTFSEPDIEVSYNLEKAETIGIAHTVELMARSLVTDEEVLVPVGASVIITAVGIRIIAGIIGIGGVSSAGSTGTASAGSASGGASGISTGTITAVGATVAAAGGVVAVIANSGDGNGSNVSFTGTFVSGGSPFQREGCGEAWLSGSDTLNLLQSETSLTGSYTVIHTIENYCHASCTGSVTGTVDGTNGTTAVLNLSSCEEDCMGPQSYNFIIRMGGTTTATLSNNGQSLDVADFVNGHSVSFIRQ